MLLKKLALYKSLISILVLASILRFVGLGYPPTYIFDEVYHAFTAREYLHGHKEAWEWWTTPPKDVAYEWTHPPVAKYGMELGMIIFGENSFGWRVGSAAFGVASILGLYLLVLSVIKNKRIALVAAFLVSIEGVHIAQSRVAMNDIYMLCFFVWSLYLAVKARWKSAAILYGLTLASKWSALYGIVPLALIYLNQFVASSRSINTSSGAQSRDLSTTVQMKYVKHYLIHLFKIVRLLLISLAVYVLTFTPFILIGHSWAEWWELHRQMWYYHTHLVATHAYQSTPLEWIFDVRPVWYYVKYLETSTSNIYVIGNPLILWLGLAAAALQLKKILKYNYLLFYLLYIVFTLPWVFSPRIMFFYHYLPSSVFLCVILATWLNSFSQKYLYIFLLLVTFSLLFISPMLYGFAMSRSFWDNLFVIFPSWK